MHAKDDGRICLLLQFSFSHDLSSCHTHKYYTFFFFFHLESLLGNHRHIFLRGSCWFVKFGCTPRWLKTLLGRARMALVRHGAWPGGSPHRNCGMNREAARYKWPHAELLMRACWMASESN